MHLFLGSDWCPWFGLPPHSWKNEGTTHAREVFRDGLLTGLLTWRPNNWSPLDSGGAGLSHAFPHATLLSRLLNCLVVHRNRLFALSTCCRKKTTNVLADLPLPPPPFPQGPVFWPCAAQKTASTTASLPTRTASGESRSPKGLPGRSCFGAYFFSCMLY